ncbi:MAG: acyltransferase family protein [Promethearchaeota archaeon]
MTEEKKPTRLFFLDNLKILLTILVVMHHTMITYGAAGWWYFRDPNNDMLSATILSILAGINQAFFMGLFFFISTYFVPGSYNRKGPKKFLKERFIRLGIPYLIYIATVSPIMIYLLHYESKMSFIEFYASYFQSFEGIGAYLGSNGPLWFILTLLFFAIFYCLWRQIFKTNSEKETVKKPPSNTILVFIIIIMTIFTFLMRLMFPMIGGYAFLSIQLAFVVQYIIMLILGVVAYQRDWFRNISDKQGKMWLIIALLSIFFMTFVAISAGALEGDLTLIVGGLHWQAFAYALWESIFCIGMSIGLITLFRKKWNTQGKASKTVSANAYTIYLIHAPILVVISILFVVVLIFALLKFVVVLSIVLLVCLLISHFILRRIPGTKRVLG